MKLTLNQAKESIKVILKSKNVPMLHGSPGCGKTEMIESIADEFNLEPICISLSQYESVDLNGFPQIKNDIAHYVPFDIWPVEGTPIPEGKNGWFIFLDEFNSADKPIEKAAYKLIQEQKVGQKKLHKNVCMVCAGNLVTDNAIVNELGTAMQSRLFHLEIIVSADEWLNWAYENDVNYKVTSFINYSPEHLHAFKPDHDDYTFACPRTWTKVSDVLNVHPEIDEITTPIIIGGVGAGVGREFITYCEVESQLPKMESIEQDPMNTHVPNEGGIQFFLLGSLASHINNKNFGNIFKYICRFPLEMQIIALRDIRKRKPEYKTHPLMIDWINKNASEVR